MVAEIVEWAQHQQIGGIMGRNRKILFGDGGALEYGGFHGYALMCYGIRSHQYNTRPTAGPAWSVAVERAERSAAARSGLGVP